MRAACRERIERTTAWHGIGGGELLNAACVDLIRRKRASNTAADLQVRAIDYAAVYAELAADEAMLDLIDADLCVSREMRHLDPTDFYTQTLPHLRAAIDELRGLDEAAGAVDPITPNVSVDGPSVYVSRIDVDAIVTQPGPPGPAPTPHHDPMGGQHFVDPPPWFEARRCVSVHPSGWMIRGYDRGGDRHLAMKVVPIVGCVDANVVLDACETASKVGHAAWLAPLIATVSRQHLATVRLWCFGRSAPKLLVDPGAAPVAAADPLRWRDDPSVIERLRGIATIVDAVEVAHRTDAAHGNIHTGNIMIDHSNRWSLVDACAASRNTAHAGQPIEVVQRIDAVDTLRWVASFFATSTAAPIHQSLAAAAHWLRDHPDQLLSRLADWLQTIADRGPGEKLQRPGRGRTSWFTRHLSTKETS